MFIKKLNIHNFRNIIQKEINFSEKINIFHGTNGVGKTSILESINYISSGKSFRKGNFKSLINCQSDQLTVYLECIINESPYSFSSSKKIDGKWRAKINNSKITKQSDITNLLPVVSIDPEVYRLVDFGPLYRRNFLDWLVFHVKHDYLVLWKKVYKCIKQLNVLYKNKATREEIDLWENLFIELSESLTQIRRDLFKEIKPKILESSKNMLNEINNLSIEFKQGWNNSLTLQEQMIIDRSKNIRFGQLQHGPHKMDILINSGKSQASQTLSRGQKKVLAITFYMSYIDTLTKYNIKPILCLDDLDAEIDDDKLNIVADFFKNTKYQVFITSVHKNKIQNAFVKSAMFHVKHD